MADDEDEWESAADNFQVNLKVSIQRDDEDEWENSVDEFVVSGTEIKAQIAGSSIDYPHGELNVAVLSAVILCSKYTGICTVSALSLTRIHYSRGLGLCGPDHGQHP
jgi:hypothetical protein